MRQRLNGRLKELKAEFSAGQKRMMELDAQRTSLHETLLRISGAIQVLEEELANNSNGELADAGNTHSNLASITLE